MKMRCGKYEVIGTGSVIGFQENPVEMVIGERPAEFTFRFIFKNDNVNREERTEFETISQNELEIYIYNANRAFGIGTSEPIDLGYINNRKIYLSYRVYSSVDTPEKLLHYTWFLGENLSSQ